MSWSRLKAKVEALFAPSVRKRVSIHMTSYRGGPSDGGRGWLLIDKSEVPLAKLLPYEPPRSVGEHNVWTLHDALAEYLQLSVKDAVAAPEPLHRALAMLDRRMGRRRFEGLRVEPNEHDVVRKLYELRAIAEGWSVSVEGAV